MLKRYKELYSYDYECKKNSKEEVSCTKAQFYIISYPKILFVLYYMPDLVKYKDSIFKLLEKRIILNFRVLTSIKTCPYYNLYNYIIINLLCLNKELNYTSNFIYSQDGLKMTVNYQINCKD